MQLLCDYHKKSGCTVILVTHNLEYLAISRERYYMQDGNLSLDKDVRTEHVSRLVSQMRHRLDAGGIGQKRSIQ